MQSLEKEMQTGPDGDRTRDPLGHLETVSAFTTTPYVQACLGTELVESNTHRSSIATSSRQFIVFFVSNI